MWLCIESLTRVKEGDKENKSNDDDERKGNDDGAAHVGNTHVT